jgi:hypothetical protein
MFNQQLDTVWLTPVNFGEIVAKTKKAQNPITASMCEQAFAQAEEQGLNAYVWILRVEKD